MATKKKSQAKPQTIHIKLDYSEAKQGRKEILISEMNLLKLSKSIKRYKELRTAELENKQKIYQAMIEIKKNLTKLQKLMPMPKIPKLIEDKYIPEKTEQEIKEIVQESLPRTDTRSIEQELEDIQRKLKSLQ
jgi:hypothetical protein